jgi:hypothetical protein
MRRRLVPSILWFCCSIAACFGVWIWQGLAAAPAPEPPTPDGPEPKIATTQTLGGPDRYLTFLSTDKPIYRAGETVFVRGVLLHHATRRPLPDDQQTPAVVEIQGPKGDVVASGQVTTEDSVAGFQWTVPDGQAGGEYTIQATYPLTGYPPAQRKFDLRAYRAPRLKTQITFLRDGYGPGDDVVATLHVQRAEGGVPAGAPVTVMARVDGEEVFRGPATIDAQGVCLARFQLPQQMARGEGVVALAIEDGGVVETASKTIPILLQTVDLTLYPEGGELVAGLPNRVYFEAFTPAHKPADLAGVIVDQDGKEIAPFRSEHEGRGRFLLSPQADGKYALRITEPSGIQTQYSLPDVKPDGVVLQTKKDVYQPNEPVTLAVAGLPADRPLVVTLSKRETVLARTEAEKTGQTAGNLQEVEFSLKPEDPDGVLIATVWGPDGTPLAERLVFRQPRKTVNVKITADAPQYVPGGNSRVTLQTTDQDGKPIDAVVGVTVTDDSVLEMIERREQMPRLPVMVLLESEVRELADAHVYLDAGNEQAPLAVDLLLGTQGWRRFGLVRTDDFLRDHGDAGRRALALRIVTMRDMERSGGMMGGFGGGFPMAEGIPLAMPAGAPMAPGFAMPADAFGAPQVDFAAQPPEAAEPMPAEFDGPAPADQPMEAEELAKDAAPSVASLSILEEKSAKREEMAKALQQGMAREADELLMGGLAPPIRNDFVPVRIYAHQVRSGRQPNERTDFTETLFWHAGIRTGQEGTATIEFGLNDAVSSFRVFADVFAADGALGSQSMQIESVEPFYLEPKLPLEVTMDDVIRVPIGVVNATGLPLDPTTIKIAAQASQKIESVVPPFAIQSGQRLRKMMRVRVGKFHGRAEFNLSASAGPYSDQVTRSVMVKPLGFPIEDGAGGLLRPGDTVSHEFLLPEDLVRGSLAARIVVYPTPLASMTEALERLIQEPYGCFEQTSSTTYPLVMAQQYFLSHQGVDPTLVERSSETLAKGYDRLTGFECPGGGYEWFGSDPGHDALTAYGLLEFTDMAQVHAVDPAMLQRTRTWLLAQRDGQGGYARKTHTLHTWLAEPEVANPYNTWALLEAKVEGDLTREVAWVREAAERAQNTYVIALGANVLVLGGDQEGANHLLDKLAGKQTDDGSLTGATTSVVGSGGEALAIETTALAVLAWLKNPRYAENVEKSIKYLAESCKAGRFGSTQSTVLALRAIVAYDQSRAKPKAPGTLQLVVDGSPVGQAIEFTAETQGAIELPDAAAVLSPGKHQVQIQMTGGSQMPYSAALTYHRLKPDSSEACQVHLEAALRDQAVDEGGVTEVAVVVVNRTGETIPMPVAIIGVPGGLEVRHDQLKELVKAGKIAAYEVLGRDVVLYWRALKPEERVELPISLIAAVPGTYTGPASRAYLYYTDEHKHWVEGLKAEIRPKG